MRHTHSPGARSATILTPLGVVVPLIEPAWSADRISSMSPCSHEESNGHPTGDLGPSPRSTVELNRACHDPEQGAHTSPFFANQSRVVPPTAVLYRTSSPRGCGRSTLTPPASRRASARTKQGKPNPKTLTPRLTRSRSFRDEELLSDLPCDWRDHPQSQPYA
jgi:hypothetical protein